MNRTEGLGSIGTVDGVGADISVRGKNEMSVSF